MKMAEAWLAMLHAMKSPAAVALAFLCLSEAIALVWLARRYAEERKYSHSYSEELTRNTQVLQELADMIKFLVLGGHSK